MQPILRSFVQVCAQRDVGSQAEDGQRPEYQLNRTLGPSGALNPPDDCLLDSREIAFKLVPGSGCFSFSK